MNSEMGAWLPWGRPEDAMSPGLPASREECGVQGVGTLRRDWSPCGEAGGC